MSDNPYQAPQSVEPLTAELKIRPLIDRLLLIGLGICAGGGLTSAWHAWIMGQLTLFVVFALMGITMTWAAWQRSR
jgi:hypothetical protein